MLARTDLAYYCGEDTLNLPLLVDRRGRLRQRDGHLVGDRLHEMIEAFDAGDVAGRPADPPRLLPVYTGIFRTQGAVLVKAALDLLGLPAGPVRRPLVAATDDERPSCALTRRGGPAARMLADTMDAA